jgi:hypothetical protein
MLRRTLLPPFDVCLVFLMGALDAVARVAHRVLGLQPDHVHQAGWQKSSWLKNVAVKAPSLAAVVTAGTPGADTLTILRPLGNTVHEAGLPALAILALPGHREGTLAGLPRADSDQILEAADRRGGREA